MGASVCPVLRGAARRVIMCARQPPATGPGRRPSLAKPRTHPRFAGAPGLCAQVPEGTRGAGREFRGVHAARPCPACNCACRRGARRGHAHAPAACPPHTGAGRQAADRRRRRASPCDQRAGHQTPGGSSMLQRRSAHPAEGSAHHIHPVQRTTWMWPCLQQAHLVLPSPHAQLNALRMLAADALQVCGGAGGRAQGGGLDAEVRVGALRLGTLQLQLVRLRQVCSGCFGRVRGVGIPPSLAARSAVLLPFPAGCPPLRLASS